MPDNILTFPPRNDNGELSEVVEATDKTHHTEIFAYSDDTFVVLVRPRSEQFTLENMVFMAERLKLELFGALPEFYDDDELDTGPEDDPSGPMPA
jgi:hypothetical protein